MFSHSYIELDHDCRSFLDLRTNDGSFKGDHEARQYREFGCPHPEPEVLSENVQTIGKWTEAKQKRCAMLRIARYGSVSARTRAGDAEVFDEASRMCGDLAKEVAISLAPDAATLYGSIGFNGARGPKLTCISALNEDGTIMGEEVAENEALIDQKPRNDLLRKKIKEHVTTTDNRLNRMQLYEEAGCPYSRPSKSDMEEWAEVDSLLAAVLFRQFRCMLKTVKEIKADKVIKTIISSTGIFTDQEKELLVEAHWDAIRDFCGDLAEWVLDKASAEAHDYFVKQIHDFYSLSTAETNLKVMDAPLWKPEAKAIVDAGGKQTDALFVSADGNSLIDGFVEDAMNNKCKSAVVFHISEACARDAIRVAVPVFLNMPYATDSGKVNNKVKQGIFQTLARREWTIRMYNKGGHTMKDDLKSIVDGGGNVAPLQQEVETRWAGYSKGTICWTMNANVEYAWNKICERLKKPVKGSPGVQTSCSLEVDCKQEFPTGWDKNFCAKMGEFCVHGSLNPDTCECECEEPWSGEACNSLDRLGVLDKYLKPMKDDQREMKDILGDKGFLPSLVPLVQDAKNPVIQTFKERISMRQAQAAMTDVLKVLGQVIPKEDDFLAKLPTSTQMLMKMAETGSGWGKFDGDALAAQLVKDIESMDGIEQLDEFDRKMVEDMQDDAIRREVIDQFAEMFGRWQDQQNLIKKESFADAGMFRTQMKQVSERKKVDKAATLEHVYDPDEAVVIPERSRNVGGRGTPDAVAVSYPYMILKKGTGSYWDWSIQGVEQPIFLQINDSHREASPVDMKVCHHDGSSTSLAEEGDLRDVSVHVAGRSRQARSMLGKGGEEEVSPKLDRWDKSRTETSAWSLRRHSDNVTWFFQCQDTGDFWCTYQEVRLLPSYTKPTVPELPGFQYEDIPMLEYTGISNKIYLVSNQLGEPPRIWDLSFVDAWEDDRWDEFWKTRTWDMPQPWKPADWVENPEVHHGATFAAGCFKYPSCSGKESGKQCSDELKCEKRTEWREVIKAMQWAALRSKENDGSPGPEYPPKYQDRWKRTDLEDQEAKNMLLVLSASYDLDRPRDEGENEDLFPEKPTSQASSAKFGASSAMSWFSHKKSTNTLSNQRQVGSQESDRISEFMSSTSASMSNLISKHIPNVISVVSKLLFSNRFSASVSENVVAGLAFISKSLSRIGQWSWARLTWFCQVVVSEYISHKFFGELISESFLQDILSDKVSKYAISEILISKFSGEVISGKVISGTFKFVKWLSVDMFSNELCWKRSFGPLSAKSAESWKASEPYRVAFSNWLDGISAEIGKLSKLISQFSGTVSNEVSEAVAKVARSISKSITDSAKSMWEHSLRPIGVGLSTFFVSVYNSVAAGLRFLSNGASKISGFVSTWIGKFCASMSTVSAGISDGLSKASDLASGWLNEYSFAPMSAASTAVSTAASTRVHNFMRWIRTSLLNPVSDASVKMSNTVKDFLSDMWQSIAVDFSYNVVSKKGIYEGFSNRFLYQFCWQKVSYAWLWEGFSKPFFWEGLSKTLLYEWISKKSMFESLSKKLSYEIISKSFLYDIVSVAFFYQSISVTSIGGISKGVSAIGKSILGVSRSR